MSRRSKRRRDSETARPGGAPREAGRGGRAAAAGATPRGAGRRAADPRPSGGERSGSAAGRPGAPDRGLGVQIAFLAAVFGVAVLVAELAGAANLGVALGIGQIAFAIAVVYLLVRR